jgi:hypothetical protein
VQCIKSIHLPAPYTGMRKFAAVGRGAALRKTISLRAHVWQVFLPNPD